MSENPYFAVRKQWGFRIAETGRKLVVSGVNNGEDTLASHCEGVFGYQPCPFTASAT